MYELLLLFKNNFKLIHMRHFRKKKKEKNRYEPTFDTQRYFNILICIDIFLVRHIRQ